MSYGRIHRSFFDSSINDTEPETRLIFIYMIVASDREGRLDITRSALARKVNLPLSAIDRAIDVLGAPDTRSRTPDHEGRRIIPIESARDWGWLVVNKEQYRDGGEPDEEADRAAARDRKRKQRERDNLDSLSRDSNLDSVSNTEESKHTPSVTVTSRHKKSVTWCDATFSDCWKLVPRKEGKREARKHFDAFVNAIVRQGGGDEDLEAFALDLERSIMNYSKKVREERIEPRYVKMGSTLIFNYEDYVAYQPLTRAPEAQRKPGRMGVVI